MALWFDLKSGLAGWDLTLWSMSFGMSGTKDPFLQSVAYDLREHSSVVVERSTGKSLNTYASLRCRRVEKGRHACICRWYTWVAEYISAKMSTPLELCSAISIMFTGLVCVGESSKKSMCDMWIRHSAIHAHCMTIDLLVCWYITGSVNAILSGHLAHGKALKLIV